MIVYKKFKLLQPIVALVLSMGVGAGCQKSDGGSTAQQAKDLSSVGEGEFFTVNGDPKSGQSWLKDFAENIPKIPPTSEYLKEDGSFKLPDAGSKLCPLFSGDKIYVYGKKTGATQGDNIFIPISKIVRGPAGLKAMEQLQASPVQGKQPALGAPAAPVPAAQNEKSSSRFSCSMKAGWFYQPHLNAAELKKFIPEDEISPRAKKLLEEMEKPRTVETSTNTFYCAGNTQSNSWTGGCHPCVAQAMEIVGIWPKGVYSEGDLFPRDFADNLTQEALSQLRLRDVTAELGRNSSRAKPGDIVIHDLCGHPRAGHISVVGRNGDSYSDTHEVPLLTCSGGRGLLKILRPL